MCCARRLTHSGRKTVSEIIDDRYKKNHHTQRYVDFDTDVISFAYTLRRVTGYFDHCGAKPTMTVRRTCYTESIVVQIYIILTHPLAIFFTCPTRDRNC